MPRRQDSPYSSDTEMCYPEGLGQYGDVSWLAQNEGQRVKSLALHLPNDGERVLREENADDVL